MAGHPIAWAPVPMLLDPLSNDCFVLLEFSVSTRSTQILEVGMIDATHAPAYRARCLGLGRHYPASMVTLSALSLPNAINFIASANSDSGMSNVNLPDPSPDILNALCIEGI